MAFLRHQTVDGSIPGILYMSCGAITPKVGMALKVTSGNLAIASGADLPQYMCVTERGEALTAGDTIGVVRVVPDTIYEVATPTSFSQVVGAKVQIGSDGLSITNTTGGTAEIAYTDAEITRVRFVQPDPTE